MRAVALWLVVAMVGLSHAEQARRPAVRIDIKDRVYQAGRVEHGAIVRHTFLIRNVGTAALAVDAKPDPGCAVEEVDHSVPPGAAGKVTVTLDTTNYSGVVSKRVRVTTSDPALATFIIGVSADVIHPIDVSPSDKLVIAGTAEQVRPIEVTLAAVDGEPFEIEAIEAEPPLAVSVGPPSRSSRHVLTIGVGPDAPLGHTLARVTVGTSHPRMRNVPIEVTLAVQSAIRIEPDRLTFRPAGGARHVEVSKPEGQALEILKVESSSPAFEVSETPVQPGRRYDLAVAYVGEPGKTIEATITLRTNDPRQQTIVIPVASRP